MNNGRECGGIQVKCIKCPRGIMRGFKVHHNAEESVCIGFTMRSLWRQHVNCESEVSGAMQIGIQPDCFH